ncbi:hypothetical protein GWI33_005180 [Rhynchophorus ferrugineus]|uniref:Uncharacterized protein n=1 Tax=Rhynchophorus ferrugineus TaxID=354439 RepID=A0A834INT7_RHYFE|nr:hypothetical protein GWI33_005180 [Rhynchophorus ferrugineus]
MEAVKTAEIKEGIRLNPRIKVIGIPSNIKAEIIEDIKMKTRRTSRGTADSRKKKLDSPQIFNKIMKERTVIVDMLRYRVEETTSLHEMLSLRAPPKELYGNRTGML